MSGFLISLEGGEGAGKTTVLNALRECLVEQGYEVVSTREPGGTLAGEMIRGVLLNPELSLFSETELLLMFAARAQLVRELIQPAISRGAAVISDRFTDASFAYQGGGRGLETGRIAELERWAAVIKPDLTFLLDVSVQQGLARARSRVANRIGSNLNAKIFLNASAPLILIAQATNQVVFVLSMQASLPRQSSLKSKKN